MDQIQGIEYLDMFIKEVLRHYSVAPGYVKDVGWGWGSAGVGAGGGRGGRGYGRWGGGAVDMG